MSDAGAAARAYLRRHHAGVLSTVSKKFPGYPFGSVVPFVLDHEACPVILISRLAEHTRNIDADPRVSLLVQDRGDDVQAGGRLTLMGDAGRADDRLETLRARYLAYFPGAEKLFALGDFAFYRIRPHQLRWIAGFGDIRWVAAESWQPPAGLLAEQEQSILAHMNADHAHNLHDYCRHFHGRTTTEARLTAIDCDGFDVLADGELLRFDFDKPVSDAAAAREALVAMARKARSA
jgi:heme oxygenase (biliverdin-IX-beta and delta-forming)